MGRTVRSKPLGIAGVRVCALDMHVDHRGVFTELFREEWGLGVAPVQWNVVSSVAHTLRGVHVHIHHTDYLAVVRGRSVVGLADLRRSSPTYRQALVLEVDGALLEAVVIPPGVAHGFYFPTDAIHIYAVSHYWNEVDELGCRWDDPDLGLDWEVRAPILSETDTAAGPLEALLDRLPDFHESDAQLPQ